jgi:diguanylate cyclase (GGDEF)-like protein/PAS domain S-box-containing protein
MILFESHRMPELNDPEIYRTVLDTLQTGVYIVDRNRRIRFWNEGAEQITGYLRQDVVGRFLREHFLASGNDTKDIDSDPEDPINLAFRDGKPSTVDVSILHKEGYRVPIQLRTSPIRNGRGEVIGAAESFERNRSASEWSRRQSGLVDLTCLDGVTGVASRTTMETRLGECLTAFREHNIPFSILLIQIDQLENFRASRGPGVVPTILRIVAQSMENCVRPTDMVGCWGENQFIAILMECRESEVGFVGERVRKMISRAEIEWWGDKFTITSPAGGAGCRPEDESEALVARAAASLKESVAQGGNCVTVLS